MPHTPAGEEIFEVAMGKFTLVAKATLEKGKLSGGKGVNMGRGIPVSFSELQLSRDAFFRCE